MSADLYKRINEVMERGAECFDVIEQCLEERSTVEQLSELSAKVEGLLNRVEVLEVENTQVEISPSLT